MAYSYTAPFSTTSTPFWSRDDWRNVALASLIPGGAAVVAYAVLSDEESVNWWMRTKKPDWAPSDRSTYGVLDTLAVAPLGYASYLVYKYGGIDNTNTRIALGLYGANVLLMMAYMPLLKQRDHGALFVHTSLNHLTAIATAVAFYKVNHDAGLWMIPHVVVSGFHALLAFAMKNLNSSSSGGSVRNLKP